MSKRLQVLIPDAEFREIQRLARDKRLTVAADKGYDTGDFVEAMRELRVTPHVAQNTSGHGRPSTGVRRATLGTR